MNIDFFMNEAVNEAKLAFDENEIPIGGLLVDNNTNQIITKAHNQINFHNNSIYHCELSLIFKACKKLNSKYLDQTTLFITLEPCTMCTAAISESHISKIYFGAFDEKNGGIEKLQIAFRRENIYVPETYGGILERDCSILLKEFFKHKRR